MSNKDILLYYRYSDPHHYNVLKIGANNGQCPNDNLFGKIDGKLRCIFVEPVPRLYDQMVKYFDTAYPYNNFVYINKAVSSSVDKIKIYYPSRTNDFKQLPWWIDQLSGSNPQHFSDHGYTVDLDMSYIPTTTVNNICEELKVNTLDYLTVDTEGHDYDILMAVDFNKIKPTFISFEHLHMDGYKTQGEKYKTLLEYLENNGYSITSKDIDNTTCKRVV